MDWQDGLQEAKAEGNCLSQFKKGIIDFHVLISIGFSPWEINICIILFYEFCIACMNCHWL